MPWNGSHVMPGPIYYSLLIGAFNSGWNEANDFRVVLYDDSVTPDPGMSSNIGQALGDNAWPLSGQRSDPPGWTALFGMPIAGTGRGGGFIQVPDEVRWGGSPVTSTQAVTMSGIFGDMVYDHTTMNPVRDLVHCVHDFGGQVDVDTGLLTIMWDPGGIMAMIAQPPPGAPFTGPEAFAQAVAAAAKAEPAPPPARPARKGKAAG